MMESVNSEYKSSFLQKLCYLFVATLGLSYLKFFGFLILYECIAALLILWVLVLFAMRSISFKVNHTDIIILAFVFFSLISVILGIDSLYTSARYYRHMILVPAIVYFLIRSLFRRIYDLDKSILLLALVASIQVVFTLALYIKTGERPRGAVGAQSLITIGMLGAFAIFYFFENLRRVKNLNSKIFLILLLLFLYFGIYTSMTRAAILGVLIIPLIRRITFRKIIFQRFFVSFLVFANLSLIIISYVYYNPSQTHYDPNRKYRSVELEKQIDRVTNIDRYIEDFELRLKQWGYVLEVAIKQPILGHGATFYRYARGGVSSAHNIFVSSFMTFGIPGIAFLLILIVSTYSNIFSLQTEDPIIKSLRNFIFACFTLMIFIGTTNDFTGGRANIFFLLMALSRNLNELASSKTIKDTHN